MAVSLILAVWLEWRDNSSGPKLAFVVFLAILTDLFQRWVRHFANDESRRTKKFHWIGMSVSFLVMVSIVILWTV